MPRAGKRLRARAGTASRARARPRAARAAKTKSSGGEQDGRRWSRRVTETSNALDLEQGVFTWQNPREIAASLARSAQRSTRRKSSAYASAMSMLNFYINRAGRHLSAPRRRILERAKDELRAVFGRPPAS